MMDVRDIRHHNLTRLVGEAGGQRALARRTGVSAAYLSQVLSPRVNRYMGHNLARRLETGMGKPYGWMDVLSDGGPGGVREVDDPRVVYGAAPPGGQRAGLLRLAEEAGGVAGLAEASGIFAPYLRRVMGEGGASPLPWALARRLEQGMNKPPGWLDTNHLKTARVR